MTSTPPAPSPAGTPRALDFTPAGTATPWARRVLRQAGFETRVALRNGEQLLLTVLLPALVLVGVTRVTSLDLGPGNRPALALGGVVALAVVSTAFTGQAIGTGFDRRNGVLRLLAASPLARSGLLVGKVLSVLAVVVVQVVLLGAIALFLGWSPDAATLLAALPAVLLGVAAFTSLGLLLAGTVRAEGTLAVANFVWVLLLAGGGLVLPSPLGVVADVLPSGALGTAVREALATGTVAVVPLLVLAAWAVAAGLACARWFRWD
ncbi:ABC-2 type transport system permease protein [Kineococcus radiotolerans]|uniref:ABC-2 type transport system permease protein n=1 Tax=Kineococcus radiotolerans TaxID=131568 RepID=A0A7W4XYV4_KINRA|nr:ABC transporter permease [Kineococcus radiotolerans]MBB2902942.1 ABC-2 type transport system permease protein [Kineococcus radiotolerans]